MKAQGLTLTDALPSLDKFELIQRIRGLFLSTHGTFRWTLSNNIYYWKLDNDKIYYNLPSNDNRRFKKINIYLDYRAQLKSYTKLNFDTFRRHHRISFYINDKDKIETTTGQLNFFR